MIITGTESYFLNSNPAGHYLGLAAFIQAFYKEIFFAVSLDSVVSCLHTYKFIATQQTFDVFISR